MRTPLKVFALTASMLIAVPAVAEIGTFYTSDNGLWKAFGGATDSKKALCGMGSELPDRAFYINYFRGDDYLVAQLFKENWRFPLGRKTTIRVRFDGANPPTDVPAISVENHRIRGLEFHVSADDAHDFSTLIRVSSHMQISFPAMETAGDPWGIDMSGSAKAFQVFDACIAYIHPKTDAPADEDDSQDKGVPDAGAQGFHKL